MAQCLIALETLEPCRCLYVVSSLDTTYRQRHGSAVHMAQTLQLAYFLGGRGWWSPLMTADDVTTPQTLFTDRARQPMSGSMSRLDSATT